MVSTVGREGQRNRADDGSYRSHAARAMTKARRARPKQLRFQHDNEQRVLAQHYLDPHWSPEQVAHELLVAHDRNIAVETIYQALYCPQRIIGRVARAVRRTGRPHWRPRRRGDERRPRFVVPITMLDKRYSEATECLVPGYREGDTIVGAFNWSAIGTLVERTTRYTILLHLAGDSRTSAVRDAHIIAFGALPPALRRLLT